MSKASVAAWCARSVERLERDVFHKNAGNFPGVVAKKLHAGVLGDLSSKITQACVVISATNGKTTSTNMVADCLEAHGERVFCNRDGSNLDTGIITTLLPRGQKEYATFECDELYTRFVLPQVKPAYFMLMNLFPDQVDRFGGIDRIQDTFVEALAKTPETVFVYNADDPYCQAVAQRISNKTVTFGMAYDAGTAQAEGRDTGQDDAETLACSCCGKAQLAYRTHVYGQLGDFSCPACGAARVTPDFEAVDVEEYEGGYRFSIEHKGTRIAQMHVPAPGLYMVYNVLSVCVMAHLWGVDFNTIQQCIDAFNPKNGRLQTYALANYRVVSNLAKNPVGFNQNIDIIRKADNPRAVSFLVNNNEGDGRDIAWLDDVAFESLAQLHQQGMPIFAGGMVTQELMARLRAAGIEPLEAQTAADMLSVLDADTTTSASNLVYVIANYTALPPVHRELEELEKGK